MSESVFNSDMERVIKQGRLILKREEDLWEYVNKLKYELLDDPRYMYFFIGDWERFVKKEEDIGWNQERMAIIVKDKRVGYVSASINRTHDDIDAVTIIIEPKYLDFGYGPLALLEFVKYLLINRGFRKVTYTIVAGNVAQEKLMARLVKRGLCRVVGLMKKHFMLRDRQYHDVIQYEALREDVLQLDFNKAVQDVLLPDLKL